MDAMGQRGDDLLTTGNGIGSMESSTNQGVFPGLFHARVKIQRVSPVGAVSFGQRRTPPGLGEDGRDDFLK